MNNVFGIRVFKENDYWVAHCVDFDIFVQGVTICAVLEELGKSLAGREKVVKELSIYFEGIPSLSRDKSYPGLPLCTCYWVMKSYPIKVTDDPECPVCHI